VLQLWKGGTLRPQLPHAHAKQLTTSSSTCGQSIKGPIEGPAPQTDRANYTTMDEIPKGEEVLAGRFFLNECPIIILFDSGVSHDFMSSTYAKKEKLLLVASGAPYVISTLRG
jgi:hypothetical protein